MENIIIQSLGFKAGESLENHIREKMNKLTPNEQIVGANVALFFGANKTTPDTFCEIRLMIPGNDLFVKESATDDFYAAVDSAVNKLQGILRKEKEKLVDSRHGRVHD